MSRFPIAAAINILTFLVTAYIFAGYFRPREGEEGDGMHRGIKSLRFFTTLSNVFCGVICLIVGVAEVIGWMKGDGTVLPHGLLVLKYLGTQTVALTLLTVMFFLGPTQGYGTMLSGTSLHMHLFGPLFAIGTFCFLEKWSSISLADVIPGMLPTIIYGAVYIYKVVVLGEDKGGWPDFYGFNRGGRWPISILIMGTGSCIICIVLRAIHNY